ncbi:hypothetical protein F4805DRAFT_388394 [Annulohypoxylon moriforme]|nr:hypothetical protein F4805DRAFT_388394 [Annulohypoxylon moriforme]
MEDNPKWERSLAIRLRPRSLERKRSVRFIPNEILKMVIENLRLPVSDVTDGIAPKEFLTNRTTLYNLCLTASFLTKYARPLLYETIFLHLGPDYHEDERIGNPRTMVRLIRTLLGDPSFCPLIKNIICPSDIASDSWLSRYHEYSKDILRWPFVGFDYPP